LINYSYLIINQDIWITDKKLLHSFEIQLPRTTALKLKLHTLVLMLNY